MYTGGDTNFSGQPRHFFPTQQRGLRRMQMIPLVDFERHADEIVKKIAEEDSLMEDTPLSEDLRRDVLRDMPQCLTIKRSVKEKLSLSVNRKRAEKRKPIPFFKKLKYKINATWKKMTRFLTNINYFNLWHGTLKDIEGNFGSGYASFFKFLRWVFVMNLLVAIFTFVTLVLPQILYDAENSRNSTSDVEFHVGDIFTGKGWLEHTILYYGHYENRTFDIIPYIYFDMPAAYFSINVVLYLISFVFLSASMAHSYRHSFIENKGGLQNVFSSKIFCGWDYGIATKHAADLKSSTIYFELKEQLHDLKEEHVERTCLANFCIYNFQIVVNVVIFALLGGIGWAIWLLLDKYGLEQDDYWSLLTSIFINVVFTVLPVFFNFISSCEKYKDSKTRLNVTLFRIYLLGCVVIGVVLSFYLINSTKVSCWETAIGVELYRLVIYDFLISILLTTILEIVFYIARNVSGDEFRYEFDIPRHTLQVIFNQALFWVGCFYAPLIAVLMSVKMVILWYMREVYVKKLCRPPKRTWRASQVYTTFLLMIFFCTFLSIAVHGYTLKTIPTSTCGPLQGYKYMYEILTENLATLQTDHLAWKIVIYITRPGSIAFIIIGLCILVYYLREQSRAQEEKVKMLKDMLKWTGRDKKYLNDWLKKLMNEDYNQSKYMDPRILLPSFSAPQNDNRSSIASSSVVSEDISVRWSRYSS